MRLQYVEKKLTERLLTCPLASTARSAVLLYFSNAVTRAVSDIERNQLGIMHPAQLLDQSCSHARAVGCNDVTEFRQPRLGAALFDQPRHPQPAAPFAPGARDLEHRGLAGDVAECDGAAAYNERS
jgi:hypothetical protein